jgi:hypothetical protein
VDETNGLLLEKVFWGCSLRCEARISWSSAARSFVGGGRESVHDAGYCGLSRGEADCRLIYEAVALKTFT